MFSSSCQFILKTEVNLRIIIHFIDAFFVTIFQKRILFFNLLDVNSKLLVDLDMLYSVSVLISVRLVIASSDSRYHDPHKAPFVLFVMRLCMNLWHNFLTQGSVPQQQQQLYVDTIKRHEVDRVLNSQTEVLQNLRDLR